MITKSILATINRRYFSVLSSDLYSVTLLSKNTRHVWMILEAEKNHKACIIIFHTHDYMQPFHFHDYALNLTDAIRKIQLHDAFQLNNRKPLSEEQTANFFNSIMDCTACRGHSLH